jgi:hypothetical protein
MTKLYFGDGDVFEVLTLLNDFASYNYIYHELCPLVTENYIW